MTTPTYAVYMAHQRNVLTRYARMRGIEVADAVAALAARYAAKHRPQVA